MHQPAQKVSIRLATLDDSKLVFDWRNDPVTISTSRTLAGVEWAGHEPWFAKQLSDDITVKCIIGMRDNKPLGVIWFRLNRGNVWETSINIAPEFRGQRLSSAFLLAAMDWLIDKKKDVAFATEVGNTNVASIRLFQSCGFRFIHPSPGFGTYYKG